MDYEDRVFKQLENATNSTDDLIDLSNEFVVEEVLLTIFGIIGISLNVFVIYLICNFNRLQTSTNVYVVNWAIADCASALITMSCFRIFSSLLEVSETILCFYFGLGFTLLFNEMVFMILIMIDWCFAAYLPRPLEKFRVHTKHIVAAVWIVSAIYALSSSLLCSSSSSYYVIFHISLPIAFALLVIGVLVLHATRLVRRLLKIFEYEPVVTLLLPTAFVACWFLSWLNFLFLNLPTSAYLVTETPVFLHPAVNMTILIVLNKDFQTCFIQTIKTPVRGLCNFNIGNKTVVVTNNDQPLSFDNRTFDQVTIRPAQT